MNKLPIRLHLTNVAGLGATQLLSSLLPSIEDNPDYIVEAIYLPCRGSLSKYKSNHLKASVEVYRRSLPNSLSRFLECVFFAGLFDGESPLLVFGDLPLICNSAQTLFVQTPHLLKPKKLWPQYSALKYLISRALFRCGIDRINNFIVQTDVMRAALEDTFPGIIGRVHVVPQPVPNWLISSGLQRVGIVPRESNALKLIYPAAGYPHKNHSILSRIDPNASFPACELILTLPAELNPAPNLSWIHCVDILSSDDMINAYSWVDAILFLSKHESYGFPLVEAMYIGLPIVCPDLAYARFLCGEQAIYFDPDDPHSLLSSLKILKTRLDQGWWPNWNTRLSNIPKDWDSVTRRILAIAAGVS